MNVKEEKFEGQLSMELTNMIVTPNQLIGLDEMDIKQVVNRRKGKAFIFEQEEKQLQGPERKRRGERQQIHPHQHPNYRQHTKHGGHEPYKRLHGQPRR